MNSNKKWLLIGLGLILVGFVGMAWQKFDFGDTLPTHQQRWTFEQGQLKNLSIDSSYSVDVQFIDSPDGTSYVEISGNMDQEIIDHLNDTDLSGDSLQLTLQHSPKGSFLSLNFQSTRQQITVALAGSDSLQNISYSAHAANGQFRNLRADTITLSTSSGNLKAEAITAQRLHLTSEAGNITTKQITGDMEIKVRSGRIQVDTLQGALTAETMQGNISARDMAGMIRASTGAGNIDLDNFTGDGVLKTTSGNITLNNQRADNLDISAQFGGIRLSTDAAFKGWYDLQTGAGEITAPESLRQTEDIIKVRSLAGNIRIK
ncbi:DUF4097 family beta strand repeat-containing protein [Paenibacillus senegalimassiliensis]|uniref:DUF4097 family beta strand repeat-containing protein n=1 Tax=Paenibacillus senegalimassiliensis TaxID=1737426 RepID=UPI00073E6B5F|nr:DUF4097 family beta strand repeat-containing protein [Paenibacillus senegalimassiliensis]